MSDRAQFPSLNLPSLESCIWNRPRASMKHVFRPCELEMAVYIDKDRTARLNTEGNLLFIGWSCCPLLIYFLNLFLFSFFFLNSIYHILCLFFPRDSRGFLSVSSGIINHRPIIWYFSKSLALCVRVYECVRMHERVRMCDNFHVHGCFRTYSFTWVCLLAWVWLFFPSLSLTSVSQKRYNFRLWIIFNPTH